MKRISKVKISVVEQVADGVVLLLNAVVRKLWQKLAKVLSLRVRQHFAPGAFTQHREEDFRLLKTEARDRNKNMTWVLLNHVNKSTKSSSQRDNSHPPAGPPEG